MNWGIVLLMNDIPSRGRRLLVGSSAKIQFPIASKIKISGRTPVANFARMLDSNGRGIVATLILLPVSLSKRLIRLSKPGVENSGSGAHIVSDCPAGCADEWRASG